MRKSISLAYASVTLFATAATAFPAVSAAPAPKAKPTFQHGHYAQAHWSTKAQCETGRNTTISTMKRYGATNIKAGACHYIDALTSSKTTMKGWVADTTYTRVRPIWSTDKSLGLNPSVMAGAHSFKFRGAYATKAEAVKVEATRVKQISAKSGFKVTWRSGVVQDPTTKKWIYEINYTSRIPDYATHTQISELPNITSPKLGITSIINIPKPKDPVVVAPPVVPTPPPVVNEAKTVEGIDISSHTIINDWAGWKKLNYKFVYIKATESTIYKNPKFSNQYAGATENGILRGAYHFATPGVTTGAAQADYFIDNGGGWSPDGKTLPGALDMEWNPYKSLAGGDMCYGLTQKQMGEFTNSFVNQYKARTGVYPTIYTAKSWWNTCVGDTYTNTATPLWLASYTTTMSKIPLPWTKHAIWQYTPKDDLGIDLNVFNGTYTQLSNWAKTGVLS